MKVFWSFVRSKNFLYLFTRTYRFWCCNTSKIQVKESRPRTKNGHALETLESDWSSPCKTRPSCSNFSYRFFTRSWKKNFYFRPSSWFTCRYSVLCEGNKIRPKARFLSWLLPFGNEDSKIVWVTFTGLDRDTIVRSVNYS